MKAKLILGMMLLTLPTWLCAQEDDAYFVPTKAKKQAEKEARLTRRQAMYAQEYAERRYADEVDGVLYPETDEPDYHIGQLRDEDEYNRRGTKYAQLVVGADTIYYEEKEGAANEPVQQNYYPEEDEDMGYGYSSRLVRFHGGLASPYYWDYYYNWAYDPWLRYGWTYDPWYADLYFGWGWGYRPYYSWHYGWYDPWYDPWYHGWGHPVGPGHPGGGGHLAYNRPGTNGALYGGRRGNSAGAGLSAQRGSRNSLAGISAGRSASTRGNETTSQRGGGFRTGNLEGANDGRLTSSSRSSRTNVSAQQQSSQRVATQQSQQNQRTVTTTTPSRSTTTTSTTSSASRGGGFSTSSSGGGFSSGGSVGGSVGGASMGGSRGGGGGGGRGGR